MLTRQDSELLGSGKSPFFTSPVPQGGIYSFLILPQFPPQSFNITLGLWALDTSGWLSHGCLQIHTHTKFSVSPNYVPQAKHLSTEAQPLQ